MLRINLLHDAGLDETPAESSALLYLVGALVVALCGFIGLAGWLTANAAYEKAKHEEQAAALALAELEQRQGPPADFSALVALEQDALDLSALASHQSLHGPAVRGMLDALRFGENRESEIALHSLRFDGQQFQVVGIAHDLSSLEYILTHLQDNESLQDARFTVLRAAEAPLSGRPRRDRLAAIDFELYAAIPAPPLTAKE